MLSTTCHCGAVKIEIPRRPRTLTNCNCSICRRYGVLWAYYKDGDVTLVASEGATDSYSWGANTQKFIRCKCCGCVMQWKKHKLDGNSWTGVNARNFNPEDLGPVRIRLLDGAKTWKYLG